MGKSSQETIKIYLRLRPARNPSRNYLIEKDFDKAAVRFHLDKSTHAEVVNNQIEDYSFQFNNVFDTPTTQEEIFESVARGCVENVLSGYNSTIFAYGQTGSGKTFSITGGSESYAQRGIIPRCISLIFDELAKRSDLESTVRVSYLQIYNDRGQDLLNKGEDAKDLEDLPKVTVHEADDEFVVRDLGQHRCARQEDALNLLFLGDTNRMYCETAMNSTSSRSHCIFTVSIEQKQPGSAVVKRSKLHLVDLAGSERVKKTGAEGKLLQEARYINLSLHFLQEVITALCDKAEGRREHIPYRQSLMTMILRDSLGGNCKTVMLATAHPEDSFMDETISTCKFAQRVASIKVNAHVNEETDPTLLVKKLKVEIATLKEELAMYRKGDQAGDRVLSTEEKVRCREACTRYINDSDPESQMVGLDGDMARILHCFHIMKEMILGKPGAGVPVQDAQVASAPPSSSPTTSPTAVHNLQLQLQQKDNELNMLLGIVQKYQSRKGTVGTQTGGEVDVEVPVQSAPSSMPQVPQGSQHDQVKMASLQHKLAADYNLDALDRHGLELFKDTTKAFDEFRRSWRKFEQLEHQKAEQGKRCDKARTLASKINEHAKHIASIKTKIQQLRAVSATQGWEEPDPEEKMLFDRLDKAKEAYRTSVAELSEEKKVYEHFQGVLKSVTAKLSQDFENWWTLRKWQMSGSTQLDRSASIRAFAEQQQGLRAQQRAADQEESARLEQAVHEVHTSPKYRPSPDPAPPPLIPAGAAPDADVQSELDKLFKARQALKQART